MNESSRGSRDDIELSCLFCNLDMKVYSFLVTLSLAIVLANALSTEEHVRSFFRPEHRRLLPEVTSLQLQDEALAKPQNDDSTKCLAHCEPQCRRVDVPDYLQVNIHIRHCFTSGLKFVIEFHTMYTLSSPHLLTNHNMQIDHATARRQTNLYILPFL